LEDHTPESLTAARKLRRKMSLPEGLLWQQLRQRSMGLKFRNQHPVEKMVVDFYCAKKRLIVEIDGIVHDMGDNPARDLRRDAFLRSLGYQIVRILASDVLRDPAGVAESIVSLCHAGPPPSALRAATSPNGGDSSGVAC
jgi:very-short-patch-repair endonuclease